MITWNDIKEVSQKGDLESVTPRDIINSEKVQEILGIIQERTSVESKKNTVNPASR